MWPFSASWKRRVEARLTALEKKMATFDDLTAEVARQTTVDASIEALVTGLQNQVNGILAGTTLPPAVQAKLDSIFTTVKANNDAVSAAVLANTPAAPTV